MNRAREAWKLRDPARYKRYVRDCNFKRKYGITSAEYDRILAESGGKCAVCGSMPSGKRGLFLDHNHTTGQLREFLCLPCNSALGYARESPQVLQNLIEYLERHG